MADVYTVKTQVDATIEEVVSAEIQEVLTASMVMPGAIMDMSAAVGPGMDVLKIPRFGNFTVTTVTPGSNVDAQANAFSSDDMNLDQYKAIQFLVQDIANLQSKVAFVQAYIQQAAKDLGAEMDLYIINTLESGVSTAAPDHKIAYVGASIAKADILEARKLLNTQNVPLDGRTLVISPASEQAILNISEFVRVDESGGSAALRNGQIGKLFGFDVLISSQAEDLKSLAFHKSCEVFARQLAPKYEMDRDLAKLADRHSISHLYGAKVLDSGKRAVLLGTA
jgi:N4-gp56 family major capsid protein